MSRKVLYVDFSNLARRAFHFNKDPSSGATLVALIFIMLRKIKNSYPDYKMVCVFDGVKATNLIRSHLFSHYKNSRYKQGTSATQDVLEKVYRDKVGLIYSFLKYLGITCLKSDYLEADLVIAAQVSKTPTRFSLFPFHRSGSEAVVLSSDVDYSTMIRPGVKWLRPTSKAGFKNLLIKYDSDSFCREFGVFPSNWPFVKLLIGDKSDGVPGVRGYGPVKSLKKIKELWMKHQPKKKREFVRIIAKDFGLDFNEMWRKFMLFDLSNPKLLIEFLVSKIPENTSHQCFFEAINPDSSYKIFRNECQSLKLGFSSADLGEFSRVFNLDKES